MALAVAHRGDPYVHRENTLPSVLSAFAKGADVVEVDVRVTRDGVPVLLHDATLERLWGHDRPVASLTYDEVLKHTGGGVPPLADALDVLHGRAAGRMLLDLTEAGQAAPSVAAVAAAGVGERVYYCGELPAMRGVRALDADAEIAMTWKTSLLPADALLAGLGPRWLNLRFGLVTPATVAFAREHGLLVGAWTADWDRSMARLLALGVDAVTTNRLPALRRVMARRSRA
ncbi:glycerophosphodiester phosphodiesterase [Actinacidiphila acidipaludis]|uniref:Glycerophosphodiester phosphodiesterase n=1 Tax=Actinacidiphila acidipaludis TaxID=2873382 RepID=A0ABS7Q947_9ACTN|nr:glycerophosphodiester phosphodiesterase [Streptomyces acidipaludis]MBY8879483.1 glycerophosphodiester phosphodiesterase [Streptomyces acidipaludis]